MNTGRYFLGLDAGTTGVKAAVFDATGGLLGVGLNEYTLETPAPDIVELDPEVYWHAAAAAIGEAVARSGVRPEQIVSAGVTGQAETLIMTDEKGDPVGKAIVWLDNRAREEAGECREAFPPEELFRMSGQTEMLPCWPAAKILWLRKHRPEQFRKAKKFLMVEDFLAGRLTGEFATCRGLMPSSLYYDIRTGEWDRGMLDFLELDEGRLPALRDPGEPIGRCVSGGSALHRGTTVAAAPLDHICGNLGSGCVRKGMISETTGCSLALCANFNRAVYDAKKRISTYHGFRRNSFALLPWAPTAGMLLKHFRDEFAGGLGYADFDRIAAEVAPGSEGLILLPHCAGAVSPVCNPDARGTAWGVTLAHKRGHWARAIMESVAYLLRDNVEALRALDCPVGELRSLGGGAKSPLWLQIKADVLNLPIASAACEEATALGAAMLGAVAAGAFASVEEAAGAMVHEGATVEPGENVARYEACFRCYKELDRLIMPTYQPNAR